MKHSNNTGNNNLLQINAEKQSCVTRFSFIKFYKGHNKKSFKLTFYF